MMHKVKNVIITVFFIGTVFSLIGCSIAGMPNGLGSEPKPEPQYMFYYQQFDMYNKQIKQINLVDGTTDTIVAIPESAVLSVDTQNKKLYWLEKLESAFDYDCAIKASDFDGSNIVTLINGLKSCAVLQVDSVIGKIFWVDLNLKSIMSADLDGSNIQHLVDNLSTYDVSVCDIEVQSDDNKLFYASRSDGVLYQVDLENTSDIVPVISNVENISGFDIDYTENTLYWCQADLFGDRLIRCASLDSTNDIIDLVTDGIYNPCDIEVKGGTVYFCDSLLQKVQYMNTDGSEKTTLLNGWISDFEIAF
jgi:hypothetical protein